jgi:hypothetical protein
MSSPSPDQRPALFAALWATATLFHLAAPQKPWLAHFTALPLTAAACWLLLRPSSGPRLALLALCQLADAFVAAPLRSNHWTFTAVAAALIVVAGGRSALAARTLRIGAAEWFDRAAPAIRASVAILYFWVVFHKLNEGFLDPQVSCGTVLYGRIAALWPVLPRGVGIHVAVILATLAIEALIPVLLVLRSTRGIGIGLAIAFHAALAVNPFYVNFSAMMIALMVPFLAPEVPERVAAALARSAPAATLRAVWSALGGAREGFLAAALLAAVGGAAVVDRTAPAVLDALAAIAFLGLAGAALLACLVAAHGGPLGARHAPAWPRGPVATGIVALWAANGASPYLGLKTESALAMYSNLRTEGETPSNHLLVRHPLDVAGFQRDLVEIVSSSDGRLRRLARGDRRSTWFELRAHLARHPDASVHYRRRGHAWLVPRAGADPELSRPWPWWLRKLVVFRPVDARAQVRCTH